MAVTGAVRTVLRFRSKIVIWRYKYGSPQLVVRWKLICWMRLFQESVQSREITVGRVLRICKRQGAETEKEQPWGSE